MEDKASVPWFNQRETKYIFQFVKMKLKMYGNFEIIIAHAAKMKRCVSTSQPIRFIDLQYDRDKCIQKCNAVCKTTTTIIIKIIIIIIIIIIVIIIMMMMMMIV